MLHWVVAVAYLITPSSFRLGEEEQHAVYPLTGRLGRTRIKEERGEEEDIYVILVDTWAIEASDVWEIEGKPWNTSTCLTRKERSIKKLQ